MTGSVAAQRVTTPSDWSTASSTTAPGPRRSRRLAEEVAGETEDWPASAEAAKRQVIEGSLYAEVHRLVDLLVEICTVDPMLRDHTRRDLHECVVELLVAFDRYRAYVVPGEPAPPESVEVLEAVRRAGPRPPAGGPGRRADAGARPGAGP